MKEKIIVKLQLDKKPNKWLGERGALARTEDNRVWFEQKAPPKAIMLLGYRKEPVGYFNATLHEGSDLEIHDEIINHSFSW